MFFANLKSFWLGASLLGLATFAIAGRTAHAGLVFRDLNVTLDASLGPTYDLDVDLDGTIDFSFTSTFIPATVGFNQIAFPFASNNGVVIDALTGDGFPAASRLSIGNVVSNASLFSQSSDLGNLASFITPDPPSGNFEGQIGYIGFKFDRLGGTAFGFAEISVNAMNAAVNPFGLTLRNVAFNDIVGQSATITAVPEPSSIIMVGVSLGLLVGFPRRIGRETKPKKESL